ncbi:MAG: acyl carrier protein [Bacteroidota bacterium]
MNEILLDYVHDKLLGGRGNVELAAEDDLLGSGLVDSMGMMNLIAFIENHFELKVPPEDMTIENFMTIDAISSYLEGRK